MTVSIGRSSKSTYLKRFKWWLFQRRSSKRLLRKCQKYSKSKEKIKLTMMSSYTSMISTKTSSNWPRISLDAVSTIWGRTDLENSRKSSNNSHRKPLRLHRIWTKRRLSSSSRWCWFNCKVKRLISLSMSLTLQTTVSIPTLSSWKNSSISGTKTNQ